jgi:hypothetical protein
MFRPFDHHQVSISVKVLSLHPVWIHIMGCLYIVTCDFTIHTVATIHTIGILHVPDTTRYICTRRLLDSHCRS